MKRTATKEDTLHAEFLNTNMFEGLDLTKLFTKVVIGYAWYITAVTACFDLAISAMLLTSIAWLQYVLLFATLVITMVAAVKAAPYVIDGIYDGGAWAINKSKSLFASAKSRFASFEMPAFATKH